jgi:hypothetical protein
MGRLGLTCTDMGYCNRGTVNTCTHLRGTYCTLGRRIIALGQFEPRCVYVRCVLHWSASLSPLIRSLSRAVLSPAAGKQWQQTNQDDGHNRVSHAARQVKDADVHVLCS